MSSQQGLLNFWKMRANSWGGIHACLCEDTDHLYMLVKVKFGESQKYVKVAQAENGYEDFSIFLQKVIEKLELPLHSELHLTDDSGTEVDADVFEELLQAGNLTINVCKEKSKAVLHQDLSFTSSETCTSDSSSMVSDSPDVMVTETSDRGLKRAHCDQDSAKEMVGDVLHTKAGGGKILQEYERLKTLVDGTRRQMVNLLVASMIEVHGRIPPAYVRTKYALGITTLFPNLKDPFSKNGYEHYYDAQSESGYLAWRIKTVQRNTAQSQRCSTSTCAPSAKRELVLIDEQLNGDECSEAISLLKHSTDVSVIKEKTRATFQYRQTLVHDQQDSSTTVLDVFPRLLDIPGLVTADALFTLIDFDCAKYDLKWL
ncbi:uncharacterized protein LOC144062000 [Vanacampus margaritifer]